MEMKTREEATGPFSVIRTLDEDDPEKATVIAEGVETYGEAWEIRENAWNDWESFPGRSIWMTFIIIDADGKRVV